MSTPDYDQYSEDHQSLLIVVKPIGPQMNQTLFNLIYNELIKQLNELKITNTKINNFERTIRIRYKQTYTIDDNDWGDFQAHRKLIGLITVARSFNKNEIESISELHKTIHDTFNNTLFDSKCFILKSCQQQQQDENDKGIQLEINSDSMNNSDIILNNVINNNSNDDDDDPTSIINSNSINNETDPMFDCDIGGQIYITSDHTCFTSRVNRSSSSSESLSSNSQPQQQQQDKNYEESLNYSLPPLINTDNNNDLNPKLSSSSASTMRTHSRNKSLDSKLLSINNEKNSQSSSTKSEFSSKNQEETYNPHNSHHNHNNQSNLLSPMSIQKRAHSSSTSSLSKTQQNDCDSSTTTPTTTIKTTTTTPHYSSANDFIDYESDQQCCEQICIRTRDFLQGLFWTLESRRLDKTREKKEKIPLLMAPCEKKDLIGLDTDTRSFKRKCLGRMQKHIADLSLMVGLPQESFLNYQTAIEHLKSVSDKLWLASAYEGLCSASLAILYPKRWNKIHELRTRYSYPNGLVQDLLNRNDYEQARTEIGKFMKQIAIEEQKQQQSSSTMLDPQIQQNNKIMKNLLNVDQFYDKYKEAASNYALYRGAGILEFECSFKAAKTLTFFQRYLKASDFIQNAIFISLNQPIDEQIERLLRISQLYEAIGFFRKAAFFKRFAALKTVSMAKNLDWNKCYFLLLPALYSYGLTLDPEEYDKSKGTAGSVNWSLIHVQLMQEIITTSLKMQNETLAIRHISFMLQCLFQYISPNQRQEYATKLSSLASKCGEGSPVTLKLTNGATIPSVNFTKFPTVVSFKIEPLKPYLKLFKLKSGLNGITGSGGLDDDDLEDQQKYSGPFIYTPIQLNRHTDMDSKNFNKKNSIKKMNFYWSEGNICSAQLSLHNYLPIELNISSIIMMTDGVAFQPKHDTSLKISPYTTCKNISLTGIPRSSGTLDILGYKIHTLGIKSDCRLKQLPNAKKLKLPEKFSVDVAPRMPLMCAQCLIAEDLNEELCLIKNISSYKERFSESYICNANFISLFEGQRKSYKIKLTNISQNLDELIELINIQVIYQKGTSLDLQQIINIKWNQIDLNKLLPFEKNISIEFDITMDAKGDFIKIINNNNNSNNMKTNVINQSKSSSINHNNRQDIIQSTSSSRKLQVLGSKKLANFLNEFQSRKNSQNDLTQLNHRQQQQQDNDETIGAGGDQLFEDLSSSSKLVELCLQFEYSGSSGLKAGFCRRCNIYFAIEIKPSILITHWDVIQAEQMGECYLVLDALNATDQEINLIYSINKEMLIEPKEKCRIPVPIQRCPLSLSSNKQQHSDDNSQLESDYRNHYLSTTNSSAIKASSTSSSSTSSSSNHDDFLSYIFPTVQKFDAILQQCRLHLLKQIDLKWTMPSLEIDGSVSVEKVPYSQELLQSLLIPPIQSEIQSNSQIIRSSFGEMSIKLGELLSLKIKFFNDSDCNLKSIRFYWIYYQDYQLNFNNNNKIINDNNFKMEDKLIVTGSDSIFLNELQTKETYTHHFGLIFLYTGVYKLELCCLPEERYQQLSTTTNNTHLQLINNNSSSTSASTSASLFNKCLQALEITVFEGDDNDE